MQKEIIIQVNELSSNPNTRFEMITGNLFDSDCQTITNAANCVGVMGKGIALEFKLRYPDMYSDYVERCKQKTFKIGQCYVYKSRLLPWILNFPTKSHWRQRSKLEDVQVGLDHLAANVADWGITSLAIPAIGCGLGGLDWTVVRSEILTRLQSLGIRIVLYQPKEANR